jgi:hypothetical protein
MKSINYQSNPTDENAILANYRNSVVAQQTSKENSSALRGSSKKMTKHKKAISQINYKKPPAASANTSAVHTPMNHNMNGSFTKVFMDFYNRGGGAQNSSLIQDRKGRVVNSITAAPSQRTS